MDRRRLATVARAWAAELSRRRLVAGVGGGALTAGLSRLGFDEAAAACAKVGKPCGSGKPCCAGAACKGGKCKCNQTWTPCPGGQCAKLAADKNNCGACGNVCPGTAPCVLGACGYRFVREWGSKGSDPGEFEGAVDLAVDGNGNVFVTDSGNHRIQKFDSTGGFVAEFGTQGNANGQFSQPQGVAVDGSGNVYVADRHADSVQMFTTPNGIDYTFATKWGTLGNGDGQFIGPTGLAVNGTGNVYVMDTSNNRIQEFDPTKAVGDPGFFVREWGTRGNGDGEFEFPTGLAVAANGDVFVADTGNHCVHRFDGNGGFLDKWGTLGNGNGQLRSPYGLAVDGAGDVYVADQGHERVQKFNGSGLFLTKWGKPGNGDGQFNFLHGVAVAGTGDVYVADLSNDRIQQFAPS